MAQTQIWTFCDAVDFLLDWQGQSRSNTSTVRNCRSAVIEALRNLYNRCSSGWSIYKNRVNLTTVSPYSTGTVTYNASTRVVTLSGGSFPSWASIGRIRFGTSKAVYSVASRDSATQLTLTVNSAPAENVAAGSAYLLFQEMYPLPVDFRSAEGLVDTVYTRSLDIRARLDTAYELQISPSEPLYAVIRGDQDYLGSLGIMFVPVPRDSRTYELQYSRQPRQLRYDRQLYTGVSITTGTTTVTGSGFTEGCVGSIIRFASDANPPTGIAGDNPYFEQRVITAFTSSTSIEVDSTVSSTLTNVNAIISDPIDIEYGSMMGAFRAICKYEAASIGNRQKDLPMLEAQARDAVIKALEGDSRLPSFSRLNLSASSLSYGTSIIGIDA